MADRQDTTAALDIARDRRSGVRIPRWPAFLAGLAAALGLIAVTAPVAAAIPRVNKLPGNDMPFGRVGPATAPLPSNPGGVQPFSAPGGAHLTYNGGRVVSNVKVVQVIWGAGTYVPETTSTGSPNVSSYFTGVLNSPYIDWLSEYNTTGVSYNGTTTNQTIGRGTFAGQYTIAPAAANNGSTVDDVANIQPELAAQVDAGHLPAPSTDAQGNAITFYALYFRRDQSITQGGSQSLVAGGFCAYHGTMMHNGRELYYSVMPDMGAAAAQSGCGGGNNFQRTTSVQSHELVETITDAEVGLASLSNGPPLAWYDNSNGEIGDICNAQQDSIRGSDGVLYRVQQEFSNLDNNCIVQRSPTQTSTTTLSSSANPAPGGQPVTLTATVKPASGSLITTGTVAFTDGSTSLGTVALNNGVATLTTSSLTVGSHTITATYSGDGTFNGSSAQLNLTVGNGTSTTVASSANPSVSGQSVTYTATVSPSPPASGTPSGTVAFADGGQAIAGCGAVALSAGSATCTTSYPGPAGSPHSIVATYGGDISFGPSASGPLSQAVNRASTSTALSSSANPSQAGQTVTYTASITVNGPGSGTPTGAVSFADGGSAISGCGAVTVTARVATCSVTYAQTSASPHLITATYGGDSDLAPSTAPTLQQQVGKATTKLAAAPAKHGFLSITLSATLTRAFDGATLSGKQIAFSTQGQPLCRATTNSSGVASCTVSGLIIGPSTYTASFSGDATYQAASGTGRL